MVKDAVVYRIREICDARHMKLNELANISGVTPSTVYSIMNQQRREINISTIKKLCDGLDLSLCAFFDAPIFEQLEQEIQ